MTAILNHQGTGKLGKGKTSTKGGVTLNQTVRLGKRIRARSANAFLLIAMQAG